MELFAVVLLILSALNIGLVIYSIRLSREDIHYLLNELDSLKRYIKKRYK